MTVDELFAEPFEPVWMRQQCEAKALKKQEEDAKLLSYIKERADFLWRMEAKESSMRIDAKVEGIWYHN